MRKNAWIAIFALSLAACSPSQYTFAPAESGSSGGQKNGTSDNLPSCASELQNLTVPVRMLFIVDQSGSNLQGDFGSPPTDPDKAMRGGSIQKFLNEYGAKANFSWSFLTFAANAARSLSGNSFGDAQVMQSAINQFMATGDSGNTPYQAALQAGQSMLASDAGKTPQTKYIVLFVSDGMPNPALPTSDVLAYVQAILNTAPTQTTFNSIFYGQGQPSAGVLMKAMAQTGLGSFLNANEVPTKILNIGDLVRIPGMSCEN